MCYSAAISGAPAGGESLRTQTMLQQQKAAMVTVRVLLDGQERQVVYDSLVLAAFSSRSESARQAHTKELLAHGVRLPADMPTFYTVPAELLTTSEEIQVGNTNTSGEAEFVLLDSDAEILVGVGSDHTDRALEAVDILSSKVACAKVLSRELWRFEEVREHWDSLVLRSWVGEADHSLYQEEALSSLMTPSDLMHLARGPSGRINHNMILFSGTIPTLGGGLRYGSTFRAELEDSLRGRSLRLFYTVRNPAP